MVSEIVNRQELYGVIVDLQNLQVMDSFLADQLQQLAQTLKLQDAAWSLPDLGYPWL